MLIWDLNECKKVICVPIYITVFHLRVSFHVSEWPTWKLTLSQGVVGRCRCPTHVPITPNILSSSTCEIGVDYVGKWMLAHHFSHYSDRGCRHMVLEMASVISLSNLTNEGWRAQLTARIHALQCTYMNDISAFHFRGSQVSLVYVRQTQTSHKLEI